MYKKSLVPFLLLSILLISCGSNGGNDNNNQADSINVKQSVSSTLAINHSKKIVKQTDENKSLKSSSQIYHQASASGNLYITKKNETIVKIENESTENGLQRNDDYYFDENSQLVYSYHFIYNVDKLYAREMENYYNKGSLIKSLERSKAMNKGEEPDLNGSAYINNDSRDSIVKADRTEIAELKNLIR